MARMTFTVECIKYDTVTYWHSPSIWHYTNHIETAEYLANEHSRKNGRKYTYVARIITHDIHVKQDNGVYGPLVIGESTGGIMQYTPEWIARTTVSAVVDGVKHSVTL
jgi:hypothetical protein